MNCMPSLIGRTKINSSQTYPQEAQQPLSQYQETARIYPTTQPIQHWASTPLYHKIDLILPLLITKSLSRVTKITPSGISSMAL
uniref:Uncharacterized protein n=1 Tax=Bionectria ochroleuca TaxID=29856 RepID=A0A0B7KIW2_BIOOC